VFNLGRGETRLHVGHEGEVCPVPDVETRRKLKTMKSGEILEVLIDYPLSKERIPANAPKKEGSTKH